MVLVYSHVHLQGGNIMCQLVLRHLEDVTRWSSIGVQRTVSLSFAGFDRSFAGYTGAGSGRQLSDTFWLYADAMNRALHSSNSGISLEVNPDKCVLSDTVATIHIRVNGSEWREVKGTGIMSGLAIVDAISQALQPHVEVVLISREIVHV